MIRQERKGWWILSTIVTLALAAISAGGCNDETVTPTPATMYHQTNLVSDTAEYAPAHLDTNLRNAWGIAINGSNGKIWTANNGSQTSTIYGTDGTPASLVVSVPLKSGVTEGGPTGIVYNASTTMFKIPSNGAAAPFIFASQDGTISAWSAGTTTTVIVADRSSANAQYMGLTMLDSTLYAADFTNGKIDMFDKNYTYVKSFADATMESGYSPFNVQQMGGKIYVMYAKMDPATHDEVKGVGNGFIDIFKGNGTLEKRFASKGTLNDPWGIAIAPASFGTYSNDLLIGNFGDGRINVYDPNTGSYLGQLMDHTTSKELEIEGLWALETYNGTLFFTAGPDDEEHGLLGTLAVAP
jgi:uncharacterized protein (TIGR03118 family)